MWRSTNCTGLLGVIWRHEAPRTCAAIIASATMLASCMVWRSTPERGEGLLARHPAKLRVAAHEGPLYELVSPMLVGDSITGVVRYGNDLRRVAIALRDIEAVQVEKVDGVRTTIALAAVGATAVLVATAIENGTKSSPPPPPPSSSGCSILGCGPISCPLVYSWDGRHWRLDSGTFGGAIMRALQRTDVDNLDFATPAHGRLRLRMANELAETDHVDALAVLAVDHEPGLEVAPDPVGTLHTIGALVPPVSARDFRGADALDRVRDADGWSWESSWRGRDTARAADLRDGLELEFVRPGGATRAHLVLDGNSTAWSGELLGEYVAAHGDETEAWYDSLNAQPALARALGMRLAREAFLSASVRGGSGWVPQGMFWEASPELVKRQVLDLDLSQVTGDTVKVRLESAPAFWLVDRVAMDFTGDRPVTVHELPLIAARDRAGRDVAPLLAAVDDRYYSLAPGDAAELTFSAPRVPAGAARDYLLRTTGWYRIDVPEAGRPATARLAALTRDSLGLSRSAVARLNEQLALLSGAER